MTIRSLLSLVALVGLFAFGFGACASGPVVMAPSLGPVDTSRPMVRYQPIQGSSCESMLDAIWDMKRLVGVDGYVEVTVQKEGCWTATAYPFTYGNERKELSVRRRSARPAAVSGAGVPATMEAASAPRRTYTRPAPAPAPAPRRAAPQARRPAPVAVAPAPAPAPRVSLDAATCEPACRAFGKHAGTTALIQRVVGDRCISRCTGGDMAYYECVSRTRSVKDVKRCNAN